VGDGSDSRVRRQENGSIGRISDDLSEEHRGANEILHAERRGGRGREKIIRVKEVAEGQEEGDRKGEEMLLIFIP
jgi:hypothetical protein